MLLSKEKPLGGSVRAERRLWKHGDLPRPIPYIKEVLFLIFCTITFNQSNMCSYFISIFSEINKFAHLIF